jgi:AcrR family transcriptional regulator
VSAAKDAAPDTTRARLIEAASALFAERGFQGTTIREITERAGANVAAGHYHFGSKQDLYLEVARAQFAELNARLTARGTVPGDAALARASRADLERLLAQRVETMLEFLLGPPPAPHGAIMQREMCDPTGALPVIVRDFVLPLKDEMVRLLARLAPSLSPREVERCGFSVVGQVFWYRLMLPILPQLFGAAEIPRGFVKRTAAHVTAFSLGALGALERRVRAGGSNGE